MLHTHPVQTADAFVAVRLLEAVERAVEPGLSVKNLGLQADFGQVERVLYEFGRNAGDLEVGEKKSGKFNWNGGSTQRLVRTLPKAMSLAARTAGVPRSEATSTTPGGTDSMKKYYNTLQ